MSTCRHTAQRCSQLSLSNIKGRGILGLFAEACKVAFYGLQVVPEPLLAEYNTKGKLTQLNLVNSALLQLLQSHLNCKALGLAYTD